MYPAEENDRGELAVVAMWSSIGSVYPITRAKDYTIQATGRPKKAGDQKHTCCKCVTADPSDHKQCCECVPWAKLSNRSNFFGKAMASKFDTHYVQVDP